MKGYLKPSMSPDAFVDRETQARRAGPSRHRRPRNWSNKPKLTEDQVRWARRNWNKNGGNWTIAELGRKLKVSRRTISDVCNMKTWKEIK